jgi:hypothetical protein
MDIQRENDIDKVSFSFRMRVSRKQFYSMNKTLDENFKYQTNHKENFVIIVIDIEDIVDSNSIKTLKEEYHLEDVDFYISINSSYDLGGLTIPLSVLSIIRSIDCDIHFSYIVC